MPETTDKIIPKVTGKELLRQAVNQITQHPKTWKQEAWHSCNTVHCLGGWCQVIAGMPQSDHVAAEIPPLIGLSAAEARWLFNESRTLGEIYNFAFFFLKDEQGFHGEGYGADGYDRHGYNGLGLDRNGNKLPILEL